MKIAILDDDQTIIEFVSRTLTEAGHSCQLFLESRLLLEQLRKQTFDLLVLDWVLPGISGEEVLEWVRANLPQSQPVLFLTARMSDHDISSILNAGADDHLAKPVSAAMLMARIEALLRRSAARDHSSGREAYDNYEFDIGQRILYYRGSSLILTPKQFELARLLFQHLGQPISSTRILEEVWGRESTESSHTVSTHISILRTKLNLRSKNGFRLMPLYGYGYRLQRVVRLLPVPDERSDK